MTRLEMFAGIEQKTYDIGIDADPYPVFRRLREEAPLYRNDTHDFYALSRFDDVERGLGFADDIDARLAPTSTVRGWETLPAVVP